MAWMSVRMHLHTSQHASVFLSARLLMTIDQQSLGSVDKDALDAFIDPRSLEEVEFFFCCRFK
tara:strand:+ start:2395 stop:2583 length:189 start_codon:yes stop_codon:yes gene_type:complete